MKRTAGVISAALAIAAFAPTAVQADPIKECEGPKDKWSYTQKGSCNSSHPREARNPGGNKPPGQQPD
jgi:hypothetical protein